MKAKNLIESSNRKRIPLGLFCLLLSLYNLIAFNIPFLKYAWQNSDRSFLIILSLVLLLFTLNYFASYLVLYLTRTVGKVLIAIANFLSATCVYFIIVYKTMMDETMLGNVFNTQYSEASGFINAKLLLAVAVLGLIPAILIIVSKVDYKSLKSFGKHIGGSVLASLLIIAVNFNSVLWVGEHDTELGGLIMPWSYIVNTCRLMQQNKDRNREEIKLPDATFCKDGKTVCVLVIGESSRSMNWSLCGYDRNTNPLLSQRDDITVFNAKACATYTTAGVKAILEYKESSELYEILPNYLYRTGASVIWRTSNWGEPPVHIDEYYKMADLREKYGIEDNNFDELLLTDLKGVIENSNNDKVLIILHTSTSHGPLYSQRYPKQFEVFTPVSDNVEQSGKDLSGLINAYDNTVVYTDYLLNTIIEELKTLDGWESSMLYVSDHGESLGENNLFMHGVPVKIAPVEQFEIPIVLWTGNHRPVKAFEQPVDQHICFHTVLDLMGVQSPVFDGEKDILE